VAEAGRSLASELRIHDLDHDSVVTLLSSFFPSGQWTSGNTVTYRDENGELGLTLVYGKRALVDVIRGPALTEDKLDRLRERLALLSTSETVIWRDVFFNVQRVEGFWRYGDDWQIVPAPPQAPRPDFLYADHPFVVEIRVPWYPGEGFLSATVQQRRAWELLLILNLVLHGAVTRIGPRQSDHVWAYVSKEGEELTARYVQPGYFIPDWLYQSQDFTPTDGIPPIAEVPDDEYRRRRGIDVSKALEMPDVLRPLLDRYHSVAPEVRDRFLRACYWYERSGAAWSMSVSLGHVAAVMAIETLMPPGEEDRCPTCGLNRAPGITQRFRDFVERYASETPEEGRRRIYKLRSALVHHGHLLDIDIPGPWGALIPRDIEQRDTYGSARTAARGAIVNWLLDHPTESD
jgi:hypothetical protein